MQSVLRHLTSTSPRWSATKTGSCTSTIGPSRHLAKSNASGPGRKTMTRSRAPCSRSVLAAKSFQARCMGSA
jgi:hypothetical protein